MKKVKIVYKDSQDDSINVEYIEDSTIFEAMQFVRKLTEWPIIILYAQNVEL